MFNIHQTANCCTSILIVHRHRWKQNSFISKDRHVGKNEAPKQHIPHHSTSSVHLILNTTQQTLTCRSTLTTPECIWLHQAALQLAGGERQADASTLYLWMSLSHTTLPGTGKPVLSTVTPTQLAPLYCKAPSAATACTFRGPGKPPSSQVTIR
jgi:hypothetical protein